MGGDRPRAKRGSRTRVMGDTHPRVTPGSRVMQAQRERCTDGGVWRWGQMGAHTWASTTNAPATPPPAGTRPHTPTGLLLHRPARLLIIGSNSRTRSVGDGTLCLHTAGAAVPWAADSHPTYRGKSSGRGHTRCTGVTKTSHSVGEKSTQRERGSGGGGEGLGESGSPRGHESSQEGDNQAKEVRPPTVVRTHSEQEGRKAAA